MSSSQQFNESEVRPMGSGFKNQEGKPYNVAKMAGVNKFLRIYYARAMELYK